MLNVQIIFYLNFFSLVGGMESDLPPWRLGWRHQFADRIEDYFELYIILLFKCLELAREVSVGKKHFTQPNKRAHDCNVYLHGAFAAKDARKHCDALVG